MNNPGSTVYVHWYGKLLQGTVVNDHDLMGMVAVSIPIQGVQATALFIPAHVYESETAANLIQACEPHKKMADERTTTTCKDSNPSEAWQALQKFKEEHWDRERNHLRIQACEPHKKMADERTTKTCKDSSPSEAWQAIQKFKEEHWDQERNHLRIDALNDFYRLWRAAIAARHGVTIEDASVLSGFPAEVPIVAVDPGSPDGDRSSTYIVDTETGEILPEPPAEVPQPQPEQVEHRPIVSEERYQELKQQMKVKLTKKQMRSTGRIEYTDSIQTSLFD